MRRPRWLIWMRVQLVIRRLRVRPLPGWQHSFLEIDHEIFCTVILSLLLIQEWQLSVSGERMCTLLVNHLDYQACPLKVWLGKLTALDMTPLGHQHKHKLAKVLSINIQKCTSHLISAHPGFNPPLANFDLDEGIKPVVAMATSSKAEGKKKGKKPKKK